MNVYNIWVADYKYGPVHKTHGAQMTLNVKHINEWDLLHYIWTQRNELTRIMSLKG